MREDKKQLPRKVGKKELIDVMVGPGEVENTTA
jgi:hypothetical protein